MSCRVLAISDVHGCNMALETLIQRVGMTPADTMILVGDLIDCGPDSRGVLDSVIRLSTETNVIGIRGNHEGMLLQSLERGAALSNNSRPFEEPLKCSSSLLGHLSLVQVNPRQTRQLTERLNACIRNFCVVVQLQSTQSR